jgi:photosystem II stability/assembly factor-like uncharacterized protein
MKNKLLPVLAGFLLFFINVSVSFAQWETHGPYGGPIICFATKGNDVFAGTYNGVFKSSDDGHTWMAVNTGMKRKNVTSIVVSGSNLLASTSNNGVFFSPNNGATWTSRNNGMTSPVIETLFVSDNGIYASTADGVFFSSNEGVTWTPANNGIQDTYVVYAYAQMGDTIYGATYGAGLYMTTNNGGVWAQLGASTGFPQAFPYGVYVYALIADGNSMYAGTSNGVYKSSDRGATWSQANTGFPGGMWAQCFTVKPGYIFAGTYSEGVFVSTNNGASWSTANNGLPDRPGSLPHNYPRCYDMITINSNVLLGSSDGLYLSSNNGANWADSDGGILATDVTCLATNGTVTFAGTTWNGVYVSTNMGASWSRCNNGVPVYGILAAVTEGPYAFISVENARVFRSSDNGTTWTAASNGLGADVLHMVAEGGTIMALTRGGQYYDAALYETSDHGNNWTQNFGAYAISGGMTAIDLHNGNIYIGTGGGNIYRSSDHGASWRDISQYIPSVQITAILATDEAVYVGTAGKGVYKITNNGNTMFPSSTGMTNYNVTDLEMQSGVLFVSTFGGGVFASVNEAQSWMPLNQGLDNLFINCMAGHDLKVYLGTNQGGAYETEQDCFDKIAILAGVNEEQLLTGDELYPNPSNGQIFISAPSGEVLKIDVVDINGKVVYTGESIDRFIDLTNHEKGMYFVKMRGKNNTATKKILIQ